MSENNFINQPAPFFTLPSSEGKPISIKDYLGKKVVLYFYLQDEMPECTKESLAFKENYWDFVDRGAVVLGISSDNLVSHRRFIEKHDLPFPLLSDINHEAAKSYGVWQEKLMDKRTYWGIERTVFVIDEKGIIKKVFQKLKILEYSQESLKSLDELAI